MHRTLSVASLPLAFIFVVAGCQSEDEARLQDSRVAWAAWAAPHGNTYSYAVSTQSWTGYATRTAVQIQGGTPIYRRFESSPMIGGMPLSLEWEERGPEVGTHPNAGPAATMEQLYDRCAGEVLTQDPDTNEITLVLDERNILRRCTYRPLSCQDDCLFGVWVGELEMGLKYE